MEVTHWTSLRWINDCCLTSDLLFQLSIHLTILRGSGAQSWWRVRSRMRGTQQTEITPIWVEMATQAKSKSCLCCVRLHSSWDVLNASNFIFSLHKHSTALLRKNMQCFLWTTSSIGSCYVHTISQIHTSTCTLSCTLSFSLRSRALLSSSASLSPAEARSWARSSATSFSRFPRSVHTYV